MAYSPARPALATARALPVLSLRLLASIIDLALLLGLNYWLSNLFAPTHLTLVPLTPAQSSYMPYLSRTAFDGLLWICAIVLPYFILTETLWGATIGKALCGLRVVADDGRRAPFGAVLLRNLIRPVECVVTPTVGVSFIAPLVICATPQRQRIGDLVAHTMVVRSGEAPQGGFSLLKQRKEVYRDIITVLLGTYLLLIGLSYIIQQPIIIDQTVQQQYIASSQTGAVTARLTRASDWRLGTLVRTGATASLQVRFIGYDKKGHASLCQATIQLSWDGLHGQGWAGHSLQGSCMGAPLNLQE